MSPESLHRDEACRILAAIWQQDPLFAPHAELAFELEQVLGEGGMGRVVKVRDRRNGRHAALKTMLPNASLDARLRFEREAALSARLSHPGIPSVFETGVTRANTPFILMEIVEGRSFAELISEATEQAQLAACRRNFVGVVLKVAEALAAAHEEDIIHRDLKPANVMVGRFGEVKLMDWGLARDLRTSAVEEPLRSSEQPEDRTSKEKLGLTREGSVLGTLGFMSPEQANGQAAGKASDVFSLGALLAAALTGRSPHSGASSLEIIKNTVEGRVDRPRSLDSSIPRSLEWIVLNALATEPEERWSSVEDMSEALRAWLNDQVPAGFRESLVERSQRALRNQGLRIVVVILVAALLAISLSLSFGLQRARNSESLLRAEAERALAAEAWAQSERARAEQAEAAALKRIEDNRQAFLDFYRLEPLQPTLVGANQEARALVKHAIETGDQLFEKEVLALIKLRRLNDLEAFRELADDIIARYPPAHEVRFNKLLSLENRQELSPEVVQSFLRTSGDSIYGRQFLDYLALKDAIDSKNRLANTDDLSERLNKLAEDVIFREAAQHLQLSLLLRQGRSRDATKLWALLLLSNLLNPRTIQEGLELAKQEQDTLLELGLSAIAQHFNVPVPGLSLTYSNALAKLGVVGAARRVLNIEAKVLPDAELERINLELTRLEYGAPAALKQCDKLAGQSPSDPRFVLARLTLLRHMRRWADLQRELQAAPDESENTIFNRERAWLALHTGDISQAQSLADRFDRSHSFDAELLALKALLAIQTKDWTLALELACKTIRQEPSAQKTTLLCEAFLAAARPDEALALLNIENQPQSAPHVLGLRIKIRDIRGRGNPDLESLLVESLKPCGEALLSSALNAFSLGELAKARARLRLARGLLAEYPSLIELAAVIELKAGDKARLAVELANLRILAPESPELRFVEALLAFDERRYADACRQFEFILASFPRYPRIDEVRQNLELARSRLKNE